MIKKDLNIKEKKLRSIWIFLLTHFLGFNLYVTILALIARFKTVYLLLYVLIFAISLFFVKEIKSYFRIKWSKYLIGALLITVLIGLFQYFYHDESITGGRDQGVYFATAMHVAKSGQLAVENELALTHPGFYQVGDKIIPHYSPAYISWLGAFYNFLGVRGIFLGNVILLVITSLIIYFLFWEVFKNEGAALLGVLLYDTTYLTVWLSKVTLNENLYQFLFWAAIYLLYRIKKGINNYLSLSLIISVLPLVRQEGWVVSTLIIFFVMLARHPFVEKIRFLLTSTIAVIPFLYYLFVYQTFTFFNTSIGRILDILVIKWQRQSLGAQADNSTQTISRIFGDDIPTFVRDILFGHFYYYFIIILIMFFFYVIYHFVLNPSQKKISIKQLFTKLLWIIPFAPYIFTFVDPMNATDLPYLLRRYFIFVPVFIGIILYFLNKNYIKKFYSYSLIFILLCFQVFHTAPIFAQSEYKGSINALAEFNKLIPTEALIIFFPGKSVEGQNSPYGFLNNDSIWATYLMFEYNRDVIIASPNVIANYSGLINQSINTHSQVLAINDKKSNITQYTDSNGQTKNYFNDDQFNYEQEYSFQVLQLNRSCLIWYDVFKPNYSYEIVKSKCIEKFPHLYTTKTFDFYIFQLKK